MSLINEAFQFTDVHLCVLDGSLPPLLPPGPRWRVGFMVLWTNTSPSAEAPFAKSSLKFKTPALVLYLENLLVTDFLPAEPDHHSFV